MAGPRTPEPWPSSQTAERDAALNAIGLRPLRFTWHRVTKEPGEVIAELGTTLALAAAQLAA
jgi:very-short-patch-repair endonuclease